MSPARAPRTEQTRLATLLEIGRLLGAATEDAALRAAVASRLSRLYDGDLLFCSEIDSAGVARVHVLAQGGDVRAGGQTYASATHAATSDDAYVLEPAVARDLAASLGADRPVAHARVVPARVNGRVVCELGLLCFDGAGLSAEDCDVLTFGAAILAAGAAQRARFDEMETRRGEAEQLEQIGRAITSSLDLPEVLARVMQAVIDLTRADSCTVWRREGERSYAIASRGIQALPVGYELDVSPQIEDELVTGRRSIQIDDLSSDPRLSASTRARIAGDGPRSAVLVPMVCDDVVVGVLSVAHHAPQRYGAESMAILERLALQAAIAVENARLHSEIRKLSLTDPLTGLPNRRQMEMVLRKEFEAARRGRPLTVVMLDLDDFKKFNDRYGHAAGDEALREFGRILAAETRAMNLAVRFGGDEFLTILSESTAEGARHLVDRIEERVAASPRLHEIGVSAGVAQYTRDMQTPKDLLEAADAAMYRRKVLPRPPG